jgi:hypothetical protein
MTAMLHLSKHHCLQTVTPARIDGIFLFSVSLYAQGMVTSDAISNLQIAHSLMVDSSHLFDGG